MLRSEAHPSLPALPKLPAKEMAGPTPWSNWVMPGRVLAGAYPASLDDEETTRILSTLLELGVNTFVCLQAEVNINTPEHAWRGGHGLRPYIKDAQKILSRAHETGNPRITQSKIDFLHLPIIDGNVTTDSAMNRLAEDCMERVLKGERLYIHCWGGHGRTGTLVAVMLGRLYGLTYTNALRYCQAFHDSRVYPQGVRSPQTPVQRAQVRRLLASQSAVAMSAPAPMSGVAGARTGASPARNVGAAGSGLGGYSKPMPSSLLSSGVPLGRPVGASAAAPSAADPSSRPGVNPSPLRSRPAGTAGASSAAAPPAGGRYGSALKDAGRSGSGTVDQLSQDINNLRMGGVGNIGARNAALPYMGAPGAGAVNGRAGSGSRSGSASVAMMRRSAQEVNAR